MVAPADVAVIGAGAVGLVTALTLTRQGAHVRLIDQEAPSSASSVAAGMLAPASETALEGGDAAMFSRLLLARDRWPALAKLSGVALDRSGAKVFVEDPAALERLKATLVQAVIPHAPLQPPGLGVSLEDDWRLDPGSALQALREAAADAGVTLIRGEVDASSERFFLNGRRLVAGMTVVATGHGAKAFAVLCPELAVLEPIKGQIAVFEDAQGAGPTLRAPGVYLTPQAGGARAGATMEMGRADEIVELEAVADLAVRAMRLDPALGGRTFRGAAGVRAATPDGWPLVGPSQTPGVILAVGARRNGWLLAPMIAALVADHVAGCATGELADAFHPGRFTR